LLDLALAAKGDYGHAMAYKAWALAQQPSYLWSDTPEEDRAEAMDLARAAARHVSDHAPSLVAIGAAVSLVSTELDLANTFVDRALALDPCNAWGWLRRGWNRNYANDNDEARKCFDRAEELSPLDPFRFNIEFGRGGSRLNEKRYEDALVHFRRGMTMAPEVQWAYRIIAVLNLHLGRHDEANEALLRLRAAYPDLTIRKMAVSIPPTIVENQPDYFDALRSAGLPKE
jgi:tetratricopeptide (TPR) repeat protein